MLYLISTPIGNLEDLSFRAIKTIELCDYLLCEDTRRTKILLDRYGLTKPLRSYHKFNESTRMQEVLSDLSCGKSIALIADAGTPAIADPGERLVKRCHEEKIPLTAIPGPSSVITALSLSGFPSDRFQFIGFLPKKPKALQTLFGEALAYSGTTIALESPFRIKKSLSHFAKLSTDRPLFIARELTKKFEELLTGTAPELLSHFEKKAPKGEFVLLIRGRDD